MFISEIITDAKIQIKFVLNKKNKENLKLDFPYYKI